MVQLTEKEFKKYFKFLTGEFRLKGIDSEEAKDIASDTITKAAQTHDSSRGMFSTHLYNVKKSVLIDFYRSKRQKMDNITQSIYVKSGVGDDDNDTFNIIDSLNVGDGEPNADSDMDKEQISRVIMTSFKTLKPLEKHLMYDFYFNELRYNEIVKKYNIPLGTVKGTLFRCKEKLYDLLKDNISIKDFMGM